MAPSLAEIRYAACFALVPATVIGCADSHEPEPEEVPGVERSRPIHTLSEDEWAAVCRWTSDYAGSEPLACADGTEANVNYEL